MPTICPNCLRPVRSEARYCGYCGSSLNLGALDEVSVALPPAQPSIAKDEPPKAKPKPKTDREKIRRTILLVIVILLCLVLVGAFLIHYWTLIGSYLGAFFTVFLARLSAP